MAGDCLVAGEPFGHGSILQRVLATIGLPYQLLVTQGIEGLLYVCRVDVGYRLGLLQLAADLNQGLLGKRGKRLPAQRALSHDL
ncbi:hypothetical protein D3C84_1102940 [compost metagenome]